METNNLTESEINAVAAVIAERVLLSLRTNPISPGPMAQLSERAFEIYCECIHLRNQSHEELVDLAERAFRMAKIFSEVEDEEKKLYFLSRRY